MWEHENGPIPVGMLACHHCDNPPCCNPAHVFIGTHKDNARDMARKGRARGGKRLIGGTNRALLRKRRPGSFLLQTEKAEIWRELTAPDAGDLAGFA